MTNESSTEDGTIKRERKVLNEKRYLTTKIGELCRYIGFGLLAIVYGLAISDSTFAESVRGDSPVILTWVGIFAALTIIFDYLNYVCGLKATQMALDNEDGDYHYDTDWLSYKLRNQFFFWKQGLALIASVFAIALIIISTTRNLG